MIIINQDRDVAVSYRKGNIIKLQDVIYNNNVIGINLFINGRNIGTFDYIEDALNEIKAIYNYDYPYYIVNGFSSYNN